MKFSHESINLLHYSPVLPFVVIGNQTSHENKQFAKITILCNILRLFKKYALKT